MNIFRFFEGVESLLYFIGVDDSGQISVVHDWALKLESTFLVSGFSVGSEDAIKGLEGTASPNNKSSQLTTRGQL